MNKLLQSLSAIGVSATLVSPNLNAEATDNSTPEIKGAKDVFVEKGSEYNVLNGITAFDKEDGDLTDQITVEGHINTNQAGKYKIAYQVKDSDGGVDTSTRYIEVR